MALVTIEKLKGKETIESYSPLSKIGMVYQTQGKFNEALEFYRKALAIKEKKEKTQLIALLLLIALALSIMIKTNSIKL